jgi:hypothetical protein
MSWPQRGAKGEKTKPVFHGKYGINHVSEQSDISQHTKHTK